MRPALKSGRPRPWPARPSVTSASPPPALHVPLPLPLRPAARVARRGARGARGAQRRRLQGLERMWMLRWRLQRRRRSAPWKVGGFEVVLGLEVGLGLGQ